MDTYENVMMQIWDIVSDDDATPQEQFDRVAELIDANRA